jgi:nitrate/nitrite transporter NarK
MPRFLKDVHGVTFEKSEWASAMPLFFGGLSCLLGGWLSDALVRATGWRRLGRALFPVAGCATAAAAMIGLRYVHSPQHAVVLMCVAAAAYDFGQGANWASIVDVGGAYAGTATGFINMVGNLGNFLQPVVGAYVFNRLGWPAMFGVYAGAYLVAGSMWLFIDPRRRFYDGLGRTGAAAL